MSRRTSYIKFAENVSDNIVYGKSYIRTPSGGQNVFVNIVSGLSTSSPSYGFQGDQTSFNIQNAAADSETKGIATFYDAQFDSSSGLITLDTLDGGSYS